jgi:peroxiredoxin
VVSLARHIWKAYAGFTLSRALPDNVGPIRNVYVHRQEASLKSWLRALMLAVLSTATLVRAEEFKVGSEVTNFTLQQPNGSPIDYSALKGSITLVLFISVQCPVSNAYNDRMSALYRDYAPKGVKFIVINANRTESSSAVAQHAREHNFPFTVYKDQGNIVADRFGATVTPEAYVIDGEDKVRYHGSIDDSKNPSHVSTQRLRLALDAVLAGNPPPQAETKAFGCTIKRMKTT